MLDLGPEGSGLGFLRLDPEQPSERALAGLRQQVQNLGNAFLYGTWMCDADGGVLHLSPSFLDLLGIGLEEADGLGWASHLLPEDGVRVTAAWRTAIRDEVACSWEQRIRDRGGTYRTVLSHGVPIRGSGGQVLAWAGVNLDITERVAETERLRESEERFRTAVEQMLDPFGIFRAMRDECGAINDFEMVYANRAAIETANPPLDMQGGSRLRDRLSPDRWPWVLERLSPVLEKRDPLILEDFEYGEAGSDEGGPRVFDVRAAPHGDGFSATWRDVTEHRRREQALRDTQGLWDLVTRATNDVIWDWNIPTGQVRWNDALSEVMGYDPSQVDGTVEWWSERMHPEDWERLRPSVEEAVTGRRDHLAVEYRFRKADGTWAEVLDRGYVARDAEGRATRMIGSLLDVTERRAAERERAELLEREQRARAEAEMERSRLRAVLDALPVGVWIADARGRLLEGNAAGVEIWGEDLRLAQDAGEADSKPRAWWPDGTAVTLEAWGLALAIRSGEASGPEEIRIRTASGEHKHILNYAVPIRNGQGGIVGGVAVNVDLTDKKKDEQIIASQLEQIESLYRNAPVGLCVLDRELRWVRVNERMAEIIGVPAEDHIGKSIREVLPELSRDAESRLRKVLRTGEPALGLELTGETPARPGVERTWVESWIPLRDAEGGVAGISIVAEEVTEQKAAERALRESERRQRTLARAAELMSAPMAVEQRLESIAALLSQTLCDLCVIDVIDRGGEVSRSVVQHRDPGRQDLAGALSTWVPSPEIWEKVARSVEARELLLVQDVTPERLRAVFDDPRHLQVARALEPTSVLILPLAARDRVFGAVALVATDPAHRFGPAEMELARDLVERAALSIDNARLYEEAQEATRDREDILAAVSHDLRSPLNTIGMAAVLLAEEGIPEAKRAKLAQVIQNSLDQGMRLIQDLLDASRMQKGAFTLEATVLPPTTLIEDAVGMAAGAAAKAAVTLQAIIEPDLPAVSGERGRLLQVLDNILGNAIRHTPAGGTVTVSATVGDERVRFEIADTGPGIDPADLPHVFDRFWRAHGTGRAGAGLGLTIARGVVEAHGGTIGVDSTLGNGACVWFEIPVAESGG
jgi:PAS domain S-box-containing protein